MSPITHTEKTMFCHQQTMCPHEDALPSVRVCGRERQVCVLPHPPYPGPWGGREALGRTGHPERHRQLLPPKRVFSQRCAVYAGDPRSPSAPRPCRRQRQATASAKTTGVERHPSPSGFTCRQRAVEGCRGRRGPEAWRAASQEETTGDLPERRWPGDCVGCPGGHSV